jgi:hypothetical protein
MKWSKKTLGKRFWTLKSDRASLSDYFNNKIQKLLLV